MSQSGRSSVVWLGFFLGLVLSQVVMRMFSSIQPVDLPKRVVRLNHSPPKAIPAVEEEESILCWVPYRFPDDNNSNSSLPIAVTRILQTFGRDCDKFVFITKNEGPITSDTESTMEFLHHHYKRQSKDDLWNQVNRGWSLIAQRFAHKYKWFVKLDADSLFSPGNFRALVLEKQWSYQSLVYFGHTIFEQSRELDDPRSQFNLGAGYGISQGMLLAMAPYFTNPDAALNTLPAHERCPEWVRWGEDVKFADCLRHVFPTLLPDNTRDIYFRETFLPFEPDYHFVDLDRDSIKWFWRGKDKVTGSQPQLQCCSSRPVLFHHLKDDQNFFFVYHMLNIVMVDPHDDAPS